MSSERQRHPYRLGGQYRPAFSFTSERNSFRMGEVLTFVSESRNDTNGMTSYVFLDLAGQSRAFDVPDDMPSMALYRQFRAVEARDGGCPECRQARDRDMGPPLERLGTVRQTIYYRCKRCLALWEKNTREAHIVWDVLLTCEHVQPLEQALRASGVQIELEDRDWERKEAGFWIYFRARIDRHATLAEFPMPAIVEWHEWDGRVAGQEAGFECMRCNSAVMGVHPLAAEGFPVFPQRMQL